MLEKIIDNAVFVVCSPRIPTPERSTGEGSRDGTRVEIVKQVVFTEAFLRPLGAIKTRIRRLLMQHATPVDTVKAWLVPLEKWPDVKAEIDTLRNSWQMHVDKLAAALPGEINFLCAQYPDQADSIRARALSPGEFQRATGLVVSAFKLSKDQLLLSESIENEMVDLGLQVLDDLAKMIVDSKRDKGVKFDSSVRTFIATLADKARGFGFVDDRVQRVATSLDQVVKALPSSAGKLDGAAADLASAVIKQLLHPKAILLNGLQVDALIAAMEDQPAKASPFAGLVPQVVPARPVAPRDDARSADRAPAAPVAPAVHGVLNNPVCI